MYFIWKKLPEYFAPRDFHTKGAKPQPNPKSRWWKETIRWLTSYNNFIRVIPSLEEDAEKNIRARNKEIIVKNCKKKPLLRWIYLKNCKGEQNLLFCVKKPFRNVWKTVKNKEKKIDSIPCGRHFLYKKMWNNFSTCHFESNLCVLFQNKKRKKYNFRPRFSRKSRKNLSCFSSSIVFIYIFTITKTTKKNLLHLIFIAEPVGKIWQKVKRHHRHRASWKYAIVWKVSFGIFIKFLIVRFFFNLIKKLIFLFFFFCLIIFYFVIYKWLIHDLYKI